MKIFHLCETLKGGIATHLNNLVRLQIDDYAGAEIYIVCPSHHAQYVDVPGAKIIGFEHRGRGPLALARLWMEWARLIWFHRPSLLHLHSTFAGLIGRTIPHRIATVYCPHGWSFETNAPTWKRNSYAFVERILSLRGSEIIAISEAERIAAQRVGIPMARCTVIYNGVEDREPGAVTARSGSGPIRLLFVGRLDTQKGCDILVEALRRLDPQRFVLDIVGSAVQGAESPLDLPANATAHGWLSAAQLLPVMRAADVLVVPSRWEGFGIVAIEAMREGKPVVAHNVGGLGEIVADGETGILFSPLTPEQLADALSGLDRRRLDVLGRAARARFESMFTSSAMHREMDRVYRRALGGMSGASPHHAV